MQTTRLRTIQQPSKVQVLLDSLLASSHFIVEGAERILDVSALPGRLPQAAARAERDRLAWSAWDDRHRAWLYTAELSLPKSRERGRPVLDLRRYEEDGSLESCSTWVSRDSNRWDQTV